eukprot:TRINITY_DN5805_c0_g2_i1.p1 TRINITY_DN5805_c0_g2~~TRINITY_DN5805_c0_g2_i1.p1  ORF type:complete len:511 (+),score=145.46 TRINITY_DN5805_c0_g2_i1:125-1657(+)
MGCGASTKSKGGAGGYPSDSKDEAKTAASLGKGGFVVLNPGKISEHYQLDKSTLGQGSYGSVSKCTNKATNQVRAVKKLSKRDKTMQIERIRQEIAVLSSMDHPNIIKLYETFEDRNCIYLVMELCTGGELFDRIVDVYHFNETQAAHVMQHIFRAIFYMHEHKVTHRDLKPENFLFADKQKLETSSLKLIDFGLACKYEVGQTLTTKAGTPYYVAPQVLHGKYDNTADNWSCGVIMYVMLCGYPPFYERDDKQILAKVKSGKYEFPEQDWKHVSQDAKDLIKGLLLMNVKERTTAHDALQHIWVKDKAPRATTANLTSGLIDNLKGFRSTNKLKKAALNVIATQLSDSQIKALTDTFQQLDADGDGQLTAQELKEGLAKAGIKQIPPELEAIMKEVDVDGSGRIDYTEFLAATLDKKLYMEEDVCWAAFRVFDRDGNGKISKDELAHVLGDGDVKNVAQRDLAELLQEVDENGDGEIDFEEFLQMMRNQNPAVAPKPADPVAHDSKDLQ